MWTGRSPVPILEVPCPNHLSCKPGLRARYVNTSPDKFLNRRIFTCATHLHGTMQILLQFCLHESVQILAYISTLFIYYIFYQRRLLGTRLLPRKLCKNLRGSGVYTSPRKSRTVYRSQILTHFWSGQKPAHLAVQKLARFRGYPVNLRRLRAVFLLFKNWPEPCTQVFISYIN